MKTYIKLPIYLALSIISTSVYAEYPREMSKLSLGMSFTDAAKEYPTLAKDEKECGLSIAFMSVYKEDNIAEQDGFLAITFYKDRIIEINYNKNFLKEVERNIVIDQIKNKYGQPLAEDGNKLYYSGNKKYNYVEVIGYDKQQDTQLTIVIDDELSFQNYEEQKKECIGNSVKIPD